MAASPQFLKKGVRLTAQVGADYVGRLCKRVVFASLRGKVAAPPQFLAPFPRKGGAGGDGG